MQESTSGAKEALGHKVEQLVENVESVAQRVGNLERLVLQFQTPERFQTPEPKVPSWDIPFAHNERNELIVNDALLLDLAIAQIGGAIDRIQLMGMIVDQTTLLVGEAYVTLAMQAQQIESLQRRMTELEKLHVTHLNAS